MVVGRALSPVVLSSAIVCQVCWDCTAMSLFSLIFEIEELKQQDEEKKKVTYVSEIS